MNGKDLASITVPAVILLFVTICIQIPAAEFWKTFLRVDTLEAILWSLTIEVVAIYAWANSKELVNGKFVTAKSFVLLGLITSTATIVSPAIKSLEPLIQEISKAQSQIASIDSQIRNINMSRELQIERYRQGAKNSENKAGWGRHIEDALEKNQISIEKIAFLEEQKPTISAIILSSSKALLMSLVLIAFQIASVLLAKSIGLKFAMLNKTEVEAPSNHSNHHFAMANSVDKMVVNEPMDNEIEVDHVALADTGTNINQREIIVAMDESNSIEQAEVKGEYEIPKEYFDSTVVQVASLIEKYKSDHHIGSYKELASKMQIDQKSISLIRTHERNLRTRSGSSRFISEAKLKKVINHLGYNTEQIVGFVKAA